MAALDYSALSAPVTSQEAREFRKESVRAGLANDSVSTAASSALFLAITVLVVSMLLSGFLFDVRGGFVEPIAILVLIELGIGALFVVRIATVSQKWKRMLRLSRFSRANGLGFLPEGPFPSYPGMIFDTGTEKHVFERIIRPGSPYFDLGNVTYTTGSGKNKKAHDWSYIALKLDRMLPQIVLDSKSNNHLKSNLPETFSRDQVLSLEGDFDRYFTLYCPTEYEQDALYVFTPDLMALLIDEASGFDVEIVDDWMFFYASPRYDFANVDNLSKAFAVINLVGEKAQEQSERYADSKITESESELGAQGAPLSSRMAVNMVAPQGRRLRRGASAVSIGVAVTAIAIYLFNFLPLFMKH